MNKKCLECGKEITDDKSPRQGKLYCSKQCKARYLNKKHRKENILWQEKIRLKWRQSKGLPLEECKICHQKFINLQSHLVRKHK